MSLRLSSPAALVLVVLVAVGASQPAAAQGRAAAQFHPNSEKYSDAGAKPATGRSGSASLESRALLGKDGTTLVEATTGSLEAGTMPGQIRKMQVKVFSSIGKLQYTDNLEGSSTGAWSVQYAGLGRNQVVQLQGTVGGIDASRTDVVTVSTQVKRRPDIAVDAVTAPAKALAGARVSVVATVSEKNGDVGARATCVLSVDGATVLDQADGIWVDAGHTVSCAFQTTFSALGQHTISVYTTGISPSDWDGSNNSASTSIEILSPETLMNYSSSFSGYDYNYTTHTRASNTDGSFIDEKTENGTRQSRALTVTSTTTAKTFAFPMRLRSMVSSNGSTVFDMTNDFPYQASSSYPGADCSNLFLSGLFIGVCNYTSASGTRSQIDLSSFDGRVTYYGTRYFQNIGVAGYSTNYSSDQITGFGGYALGPSVNTVLELTDARGELFAARPVVTLQRSPIQTQSSACSRNSRTGITTCSELSKTGTNVTGSASDNTH